MMLLYALLVALVLLSANNNVLAFARTPPRQSISMITQTSISSTQQHQRTAVTIDIPFCAEATSIYNSTVNLWDVNINRLDTENKTNDNSIRSYDATSPRSWMDHIEHSSEDNHGVGAYTVIRCDATYNFNHNTCQWKIWGIGFHMNRLCSSYRMLMKHNNEHSTSAFSSDYESKLQTNDIISSLLDEATTSLMKEDVSSTSKQDGEYVRTLMVTILWTPSNKVVNDSTDANYKPIIRGHSTFAGKARTTNSNDDLFPSPISACLGIPSELTSEELAKLPKRYSNDNNDNIKSQSLVGANAKISTWCTIRKPLEDSTRFKIPESNIGEVLLVTQDENKQYQDEEDFINSLSILEGLTSNLFIIYKDGTIRTAPVGKVLLGYARHLVKEEIETRNDLHLDLNPPTIQDAKDGLWSEVFITSSKRLIVPVNRVLIPSIGDANEEPTVLWESNDHSVTRSLWSAICSRGNTIT